MADGHGLRWAVLRPRRWPVRVRVTVVAVAVVGAALAVGGVALAALLRDRLTDDLRTATGQRARDVAALLDSGADPAVLPLDGQDDLLVQVVGGSGDVLASSAGLAGSGPVDAPPPGGTRVIRVPVDDDRFLAAAASARTGGETVTVVVARSLDDVDEAVRVATQLALLGLPLLLGVVALTTWRSVARALAPVEAMRREVDAISAAELHRRVPTPPGGDEVGRLAVTMNRMLERLERSQERQRRFVSDASHELRSPVAGIRQHAEVALAHPERTTVPDLAGAVLAEDLRVQRLVEDLLVLARADEGAVAARRQPVDLDDLVFEEAGRLRRETRLVVDTSAVSAGRVAGDAAALRRVVRNLAENAARHADATVAFALTERDGRVVLRVDDDGPGIPPADRQRVFGRFVRLDAARSRDAGGSGLGLAIVSDLVAAHGGTVTVDDSHLGGARVEVSFSGASGSS